MDRQGRKRALLPSFEGPVGTVTVADAGPEPVRMARTPRLHAPTHAARARSGWPDPRTVSRPWLTVLAYLLGLAVALPLLLPVLQNIEDGRRLVELGVLSPRDRLRPVGLGPVSGLMLYLFATPILIGLARHFIGKLATIAGMAVFAVSVSAVTSVFEQGRVLLGLGLSAMVVAALGGVGAALWWYRRTRRLRRTRIAASLARLTREVANTHRQGPSPDQGLDVVSMVERMALGALWEAAQGERDPPFDTRVAVAMADIRRDLARNRRLDPNGVGMAMMDSLLPRVRHRLAMERRGRRVMT